MVYVMSDIHGMRHHFFRMLKEIRFCDTDELYILGDIIDRGDSFYEIYEFIRNHRNVHLLMGNHEKMMLDFIRKNNGTIKDIGYVSDDAAMAYHHWVCNGGFTTLQTMESLDDETQNEVCQYFSALPLNALAIRRQCNRLQPCPSRQQENCLRLPSVTRARTCSVHPNSS